MSIALWCVLIAGILPILVVGFAKAGGPGYDNARPRESASAFTGFRARMFAAHNNAFEAFPFFAAAVLVAEMKGPGGTIVNSLAILWVMARIAHAAAYGANQPTLRSLSWTVAFFAAIAIFVSPAYL